MRGGIIELRIELLMFVSGDGTGDGWILRLVGLVLLLDLGTLDFGVEDGTMDWSAEEICC